MDGASSGWRIKLVVQVVVRGISVAERDASGSTALVQAGPITEQ